MRHLTGLILLLFAAGCGDGGLSFGPCKSLDQATCGLRSDCRVGTCTACGGAPTFAGCWDPAIENAPPCPGVLCILPCDQITDQATCSARSDCRADFCPTCTAAKQFTRCAKAGDPQVSCPLLGCPQPPPCAQVQTKDACELRSDCHSVFVDPMTCLCAQPGCCMMWNRCVDGDQARCTGQPACKSLAPVCEGDYTLAYTDVCYEGCVQKKDCAP